MAIDPAPPALDDLEVSLFGPGFGEALAIHLTCGRWLLVDSCEDEFGEPASVAYLDSLGVNLKKQVECVIISHWHDDHIRQMGEVVRRCSKARVAFSDALSGQEFLTLMNVAEGRAILDYSGVTEIADVYAFLERARRIPKRATADSRLYSDQGAKPYAIWSLSPSPDEVHRSVKRFAELLQAHGDGEAEWVDPTDLNQLAIVLYVEVGEFRLLLGSDLTVARRGWELICSSTERPKGRAAAFKVPHHGSARAQLDQVWTDLLEDQPYAMLTPFNRGSGVPNANEIGWLASKTPHAWITSAHPRLPVLDPVVARLLDEASNWAVGVEAPMGQIRLRRPAYAPGAWSFEASEAVRHLS